MCPKTRQRNASNIDKLDVLRFIWDHTRKYASFILAAPTIWRQRYKKAMRTLQTPSYTADVQRI